MTRFGYLILALVLLVLGAAGALGWWLTHLTPPMPAEPVATTTPACALGSCPFEIHEEDSGKAFTYTLTSRFSVILDETKHPKAELACAPAGILGPISNVPSVPPPLYAARFEGIAPGTCTLTDRDFSATITIAAEGTSTTAQMPVKLYYYDPKKDTDANGNVLCSAQGLVTVDRTLPATATPADAVKLLLMGSLTSEEKAAGITTEFPLPGVLLSTSSLEKGTLTLTFADPEHKTSGGSCRASILWKEIAATAKQFPGVSSVRFSPADLFQP